MTSSAMVLISAALACSLAGQTTFGSIECGGTAQIPEQRSHRATALKDEQLDLVNHVPWQLFDNHEPGMSRLREPVGQVLSRELGGVRLERATFGCNSHKRNGKNRAVPGASGILRV